MDITYKVVNVYPTTHLARGEVDGENVIVEVLEIEVLLRDTATGHGHINLRFLSRADKIYALKTFVPGQSVVITLPPEGTNEINNDLPESGDLEPGQELPPLSPGAPDQGLPPQRQPK